MFTPVRILFFLDLLFFYLSVTNSKPANFTTTGCLNKQVYQEGRCVSNAVPSSAPNNLQRANSESVANIVLLGGIVLLMFGITSLVSCACYKLYPKADEEQDSQRKDQSSSAQIELAKARALTL